MTRLCSLRGSTLVALLLCACTEGGQGSDDGAPTPNLGSGGSAATPVDGGSGEGGGGSKPSPYYWSHGACVDAQRACSDDQDCKRLMTCVWMSPYACARSCCFEPEGCPEVRWEDFPTEKPTTPTPPRTGSVNALFETMAACLASYDSWPCLNTQPICDRLRPWEMPQPDPQPPCDGLFFPPDPDAGS